MTASSKSSTDHHQTQQCRCTQVQSGLHSAEWWPAGAEFFVGRRARGQRRNWGFEELDFPYWPPVAAFPYSFSSPLFFFFFFLLFASSSWDPELWSSFILNSLSSSSWQRNLKQHGRRYGNQLYLVIILFLHLLHFSFLSSDMIRLLGFLLNLPCWSWI